MKCPNCGSEKIVCPSCGGVLLPGTKAAGSVGFRCKECGMACGFARCEGCGKDVISLRWV
ncbi:MAG: hypothetical protein CW694_06310 [Candidatus Syntrophoarchaeum sp. WYZ-LMO15]|nr:MAG: hypothetical protein CW694_06310 [Candidatus Syntrophoarchaeum sp. WYZ-LMO15]